jgi:hypothetical protein
MNIHFDRELVAPRGGVLRLAAAATALALLLLGGCAAINTIGSDVSTFGEWPADRKPSTYAFERLPSQAARASESAALEAAAVPALAKAGFTPAAEGAAPDVLVQVGARADRADYQTWDDALWWRGGFGYWRHGPWLAPRWGLGVTYRGELPRYDREVALLIRDRASGKPLFEARATNEGNGNFSSPLMTALFNAALADFPKLGLNPRRVVVSLTPTS